MPDLVDKVFDYTSYAVRGATTVAQNGYDVTRDAAQYSYDTSKWIGNYLWNGATGVYSQVKETLPENIYLVGPNEAPPPPPLSTLVFNVFANLITQNRTTIGLGITGPTLGYFAFKLYRHYIPIERTASRLEGRYRYEVIVVAGSINSTFVYKLVNDLNLRGFIVYVTVSDEDELRKVEEINDADVRPLVIDYTNDVTVRTSLLKLAHILDSRINNVPWEAYYHFKGALLIPNYNSLPKLKRLEEIGSKEYIRMTELFFLRFNTLLSNGLLSILRESNARKADVINYNKAKISGGFSKLLFINFLTVTNEDKRRLVHDISLDINKTFFNKVYEQYSSSRGESLYRSFGVVNDTSLIDIASLDIVLHKKTSSTMVSISTILQRIAERLFFRLTPNDIHRQIYDMLNQPVLKKRYRMEN